MKSTKTISTRTNRHFGTVAALAALALVAALLLTASGTASEGRHTFEVRAVDDQGDVDPSPAVWIWAVERNE